MLRSLAALASLLLVGGFATAGERSHAHDATHEGDRDRFSTVAKPRLQSLLAAIIEKQRAVGEGIPHLPRPPHAPLPREPRIGDGAVIVLAKGGTATVKHTIDWRAYVGPKGREDELDVTLTASDASLKVPEKLTLEFERHQFRFEYEVKAGEKTGEFTITLTPTAGKPVAVKVIVK